MTTTSTTYNKFRKTGHTATGWPLGRKAGLGVALTLLMAIGTTAASAVWWTIDNVAEQTAAAARTATATLAAELRTAGTLSATNSIQTLDIVSDNQLRAIAAALAFLIDAAESAGHAAPYIDDTLRQITFRSALARIDVIRHDLHLDYSSTGLPSDAPTLTAEIEALARTEPTGATTTAPTLIDTAGGLTKQAAAQLTQRPGAVVVRAQLDSIEAQRAYGDSSDTPAARSLATTHAGSIALTLSHALELTEDARWERRRIQNRLQAVVDNTSVTRIRVAAGAATTIFEAASETAPGPPTPELTDILGARATTTRQLDGFRDRQRRWVTRTAAIRTPGRLATVVDLATHGGTGTLVDTARQASLDRFATLPDVTAAWIATTDPDDGRVFLAAAAPRPGTTPSPRDAWAEWDAALASAAERSRRLDAPTATGNVTLWPEPAAVIVSAIPLDGRTTLVVRSSNTAGLHDMRSELLQGIAGAAALILLMTGVTIYLTRRWITAPIARVAAATTNLANGRAPEPNSRLASRSDELGALTRNFDTMAREVLAKHDALSNLVTERTARLTTALEQIQQDVRLAQTVQRAMTAPTAYSDQGLTLEARIQPATELAGDFTIARTHPDQVTIGVFDVAGKGVAAALFMVTAHATLNKALDTHGPADLPGVITHANHELSANNDAGMFVTGFIATIETQTGRMRYVSAGHEPPLVSRKHGCSKIANTEGIPLGLDPTREFRERTDLLEAGDALVIYTDGVTDACNPNAQEFRETRLQRTVQRQHGQQASTIIDTIWTAVSRFTQDAPPVDDMTCAVVARRT